MPQSLPATLHALPVFTQTLTHKDRYLHVWRLDFVGQATVWGADRRVAGTDWPAQGLAAPIRKLLQGAAAT